MLPDMLGCVWCRRDRWQLDWPGGASSRRSVRSVARLSLLKSLMAKQSDKSLQDELDSLVDLLKQVWPAPTVVLCQALRLTGPLLVSSRSVPWLWKWCNRTPGIASQSEHYCSNPYGRSSLMWQCMCTAVSFGGVHVAVHVCQTGAGAPDLEALRFLWKTHN